MNLAAEQERMRKTYEREKPVSPPRSVKKITAEDLPLVREPSRKTKEAFALRAKGMTYAEIGRWMNVTRQRVQQLVRPPFGVYTRIVHRAGKKCEECRIDLRSGEGHVHHIKGDDYDFNNVANLLYLCRSCHRKAHWETEGK